MLFIVSMIVHAAGEKKNKTVDLEKKVAVIIYIMLNAEKKHSPLRQTRNYLLFVLLEY